MLDYKQESLINRKTASHKFSTFKNAYFSRNTMNVRSSTGLPALKKKDSLPAEWNQSAKDLNILVPIDQDVRGKNVKCVIHPTNIELKVKDEKFVWGNFQELGLIDPDESYWSIEEDGKLGKHVAVTLGKPPSAPGLWPRLFEEPPADLTVTSQVFFELKIDDIPAGKLVFGLFGKAAPRTAENFRALCTGEKGTGAAGKPLHYRGNIFHRIIRGFMAQAGDITRGDGTGGESIYGEMFDDEAFKAHHDAPLLLSMANAGPNTNGSQFFITFSPQAHLDGKHVVFGRVVGGAALVKRLEAAGSPSGIPLGKVEISDCGELPGGHEAVAAVEQENSRLVAAAAAEDTKLP